VVGVQTVGILDTLRGLKSRSFTEASISIKGKHMRRSHARNLAKVQHRDFDRLDLIKVGDDAARLVMIKDENKDRFKFFPLLVKEMQLKRCAEIGVYKGEFSLALLQEPIVQILYCVDNWSDDYGPSDGNLTFQEAERNLKSFSDAGRVVIIRKVSSEAARDIPDGSIDFCYIDGDHTYEGAYIDIRAWLPKVSLGGVIAGHDYNWECVQDNLMNYRRDSYLTMRVKPAVDDFVNRYGYDLRVTGHHNDGWWFVKNREADDPDKIYLLRASESSGLNSSGSPRL